MTEETGVVVCRTAGQNRIIHSAKALYRMASTQLGGVIKHKHKL